MNQFFWLDENNHNLKTGNIRRFIRHFKYLGSARPVFSLTFNSLPLRRTLLYSKKILSEKLMLKINLNKIKDFFSLLQNLQISQIKLSKTVLCPSLLSKFCKDSHVRILIIPTPCPVSNRLFLISLIKLTPMKTENSINNSFSNWKSS